MKLVSTIFGLLGGFIVGMLLTEDIVGGGIGAGIGLFVFRWIGGKVGSKSIEAEAEAISGPKRNTAKAIFWWFILFIIAATALILFGLKYK